MSAPPTSFDPNRQPISVTAVSDGDSFRTPRDEVRLIGVNAPESDECFGAESRQWLEGLLDGKEAEMFPISVDQFDRVLAEVFVDGASVNLAAVRTGHAFALSEFPAFIEGETQAREGGLGLWGDDICGASGERASLVIEEIDYNPSGEDEAELVVIGNQSGGPIDLGRFVLRDESSVNRFEFPAFRLDPAATVTVTTACRGGGDALGWCTGQPVWNNGGDAVILLDAFGRVVAFRRY